MNPKPDDPDNHVPPLTPGDHWDDLDESTERSRVGLPPRRVERGLPPKKESLAEKVNLKTRMTKMEPDAEQAPPEENSQIPRRSSAKPVRRAKAKKEPAPEAPLTPPEESGEIAVVLPNPKTGRRGRVNEIKPGGDKPAARQPVRPAGIAARTPSVETDSEAQEAVRKRRRFLRGERHDWGTKEGRGSMKWMLLTALGVSGLVVLAVVMNQRAKDGKVMSREQSLYSSLAPDGDEISGDAKSPDGIDKLLNSRPEAEAIFATYATAKSPEDFIGLVHAPSRNRQLIESGWKPLGAGKGWVPAGDAAWYVKDAKEIRFAILEGTLPDFTSFRAYFRQDGEGDLKMDWKATTGYGSADFADLKAGKGDGSEVRAWLSPADFYTFAFPEGGYRSFRVVSPKGDTTISGYVPAGSDLEKELLELFRPSQITGETNTEIQAILSLAFSDGDSLPEQWLIADILRTDWLDE